MSKMIMVANYYKPEMKKELDALCENKGYNQSDILRLALEIVLKASKAMDLRDVFRVTEDEKKLRVLRG